MLNNSAELTIDVLSDEEVAEVDGGSSIVYPLPLPLPYPYPTPIPGPIPDPILM